MVDQLLRRHRKHAVTALCHDNRDRTGEYHGNHGRLKELSEL